VRVPAERAATMTDRPTIEQQLHQRQKPNRKSTQTPVQTTRSLVNALLGVWLLISLVGLIAAVLGLALLMRAVF
jgi:beta-lactamase regulating signal transducer with metallopeptidase domain